MTRIQPILLLLLVLLTVLYFAKMRSRLLDRIVVSILAALGLTLVAVPAVASRLARTLGVGRGVDVVIYFSIVGIGFFILLLISKVRELENKITVLTREVALSRSQRIKSS